jgi:hypothetical protein
MVYEEQRGEMRESEEPRMREASCHMLCLRYKEILAGRQEPPDERSVMADALQLAGFWQD